MICDVCKYQIEDYDIDEDEDFIECPECGQTLKVEKL